MIGDDDLGKAPLVSIWMAPRAATDRSCVPFRVTVQRGLDREGAARACAVGMLEALGYAEPDVDLAVALLREAAALFGPFAQEPFLRVVREGEEDA